MTDPTTATPSNAGGAGSTGGGRIVIVRERRQRPLIAGVVLAAVGIGLVVIGSLVLTGVQAVQVIGADARADYGDPVTFDAESGRTYDVVYLVVDIRLTTTIERIVADTRCEITSTDGTTQTISGARQGVSLETDVGATIGNFQVPEGPTTVVCDFESSGGGFVSKYAVAEARATAKYVAYGVIAVAAIAGLVGAFLIKVGLAGRAVRMTRGPDGRLTPAPRADHESESTQ